MINRRKFLKATSLLTLGSMIFPYESVLGNNLFSGKYSDIGLILYTVRDAMKKDVEGTLKKLADIGYKNLEAAGYSRGQFYGMKPKKFKALVNSLDMNLLSSHTRPNLKNVEQVADDAAKAGLKYVVIPSIQGDKRKSIDGYKKAAEEYNKMGEVCKKAGVKLGYHNHAFEFEKLDGKIPYHTLLEGTDKELVTMELDIYWIIKGGCDPIDYFKKYQGRFELWHVKDMEDSEERFFTEVGNGTINFEEIFKHTETAGMKYFFVEQDKCKNHKPLESVKISYEYLSKMLK